jgi:hypothetical protein
VVEGGQGVFPPGAAAGHTIAYGSLG